MSSSQVKTRTNGASRDFSTQTSPRSQSTPVRERRPQRSLPLTGYRQRLGSQQVVSVRGRRTAPIKQASIISKLSGMAIALLIGGIVVAMWLSGLSTQQTFAIQNLVSQETQLEEQIETLKRDYANASSTAEIARKADEMGMALPQQPGILVNEKDGDTVEQRAPQPGVNRIIDINGAPVVPNRASSDPDLIAEMGDSLEARPESEHLRVEEGQAPVNAIPQEPATAPYAPSVRGN